MRESQQTRVPVYEPQEVSCTVSMRDAQNMKNLGVDSKYGKSVLLYDDPQTKTQFSESPKFQMSPFRMPNMHWLEEECRSSIAVLAGVVADAGAAMSKFENTRASGKEVGSATDSESQSASK